MISDKQKTHKTPDSAGCELERRIAALKNQNELLKSQLMNTSLINELTKVMHTSTDPEAIIRTVLLGIQEITELDRVILFAIDRKAFCLRPQAWVGLDAEQVENITIPLGFEGGEITDAIFLNRHFVIEEPDPDADLFLKRFQSRSYLVMPFVSKITRTCWEVKGCDKTSCPVHGGFNPYCWSIIGAGDNTQALSEDLRRKRCLACENFKVEGVFWMDRTVRKTEITGDNITTISTILNQAGVIVENFRIFNALEIANDELQGANSKLKVVNHDLRVAQAKINKDLDHARAIQHGLLPQNIEDTDGLSVGATYIPADAVGGDYYDVFAISDELFGIVVADVSGHGVASSLIMSMAKILLKTFAGSHEGPQKTLERINQTFLDEIRTDNFVTVFYGILDTTARTLQYTSAGHCPVLLIDKLSGSVRRIKADGLFLGVFPDMMLEESCLHYEPGQYRIVLYTDGLTEAKNANDKMFEVERLEKAARRTLKQPPRMAMKKILDAQKRFCGKNQDMADDITLLVVDI
jgi:serine phosphatase RsbU (regulator of sigma subunit)